MAMTGSLLPSGSPLHEQIRNRFNCGWESQTKTYTIKAIYRLGFDVVTGREIDVFQALASPLGGSQLTFLGARRACYIGDRDQPLELCDADACHVCNFLRGFSQPGYNGSGALPGEALCTTVTSLADDSVMNHYVRSHAHVMVVCATTVTGFGTRFAPMNSGPVPVGLVVYTRNGWKLPQRRGQTALSSPAATSNRPQTAEAEDPASRNPAGSPPPTQQQGQGSSNWSSNWSSNESWKTELKESLANAIVSKKPNVKWDDIAGLEAAKKVLQQTLVFPQRFPNLFTGKRKLPGAILLYGPPGTGKSYLASAVATEVDCTLFRISSGDIMSKWLGESEMLVRQLFVTARQKKPAIIFIDEIDALCANREGPGGANEHTARMKTELLIQMQGLDSDNDGLVVLAATNLPWALDPAARRRFQKRIYVPLPDQKAREDLFRIHSGGEILADDELSELARETDGFSGSDIHTFVEEALRVPLDKIHAATRFKKVGCRGSELYTPCDPREGGTVAMTWKEIPKDKLKEPRVTAEDFFKILRGGKVKSTVGADELGKYEEWTETYGIEGK